MDDSDSEDEVFMGRIGEKEKQILLNEFRQFGRNPHLTSKTDIPGSCHTMNEDDKVNLKTENSCLVESGFEEENRTCMSDSENVETDLNCTLDNVENLLAQGKKFMLTDDNGADITHLLPDGCNMFDSYKEKSLLEESNMTSLASSNITIEYEQENIDTSKSVEEVHSFSSSETNLNDTLENVENLLSQGMKYVFTDENGMDVSHLLPDGLHFRNESANENDVQCEKAKYAKKNMTQQNKCGSVIREYINENPPQLIANVKAKARNTLMAKNMCVKKPRIVNSDAHHQNWTRKAKAVNINSPLPAVDYKSTVGLMLKNVPASPKAGSTPVVVRHLGRIRLPSKFRPNSSANSEEVSLLSPSPVTKYKTPKPRNNVRK